MTHDSVLSHFGLIQRPFALTPNRDLFFPAQHQAILASAAYALARGDGIVKITGEIGTGKTMLCRLLLDHLYENGVDIAYIASPHDNGFALAILVCDEFGITAGHDPYGALGRFLSHEDRRGRQAVIVVDEAQALGRNGLEAIRLLSNYETDDDKLLQIILFGQPELDMLLKRHDLRQLAQRISHSFRTEAFDAETSRHYIQHRIDSCADLSLPRPHTIFTKRALQLLSARAMGIPRLLNLLAGYADGAQVIDRKHVLEAVSEGIPGQTASPEIWPLRLLRSIK